MNGNSFVTLLLHSPLHGMLGDTMIITVTGCKTGRKYSTPVGFFEEGGCLWVLSSRDRTWWRNLRGGQPVSLYLRGKELQARAEPVLDDAVVRQRLESYLSAIPMAAKSLHARMLEGGKLHPDDAARLTAERLFIRIDLGTG